MDMKDIERINELYRKSKSTGLTPEEKECLSVQKGTLTEQERTVMESHVEYTSKLLSKIRFHNSVIDLNLVPRKA